jgi:hypothetical protein
MTAKIRSIRHRKPVKKRMLIIWSVPLGNADLACSSQIHSD